MNSRPIKSWVDPSKKRRKSNWWDSKKTKQILQLDYSYIEKLALKVGGNYEIKEHISVGNDLYAKPEFTCEICGKGSAKRKYRPACFYPTDVGYYYKCRECEPSKSLYQFLLDKNPDLASKYQFERWGKKLTGSSTNCPSRPEHSASLRKEYYQKVERERKERNKRAYEERNS